MPVLPLWITIWRCAGVTHITDFQDGRELIGLVDYGFAGLAGRDVKFVFADARLARVENTTLANVTIDDFVLF